MYTHQTKIMMHDTDAAGLLFFSNQLKIAHDAYEGLLEHIGYSFPELIRKKEFFLPIVHTQADFTLPLFVGDPIEVQVAVEKIGKSSFTLAYTFLNSSQKTVGTAQTVHVAVEAVAHKKVPLPSDLRTKLESFQPAA